MSKALQNITVAAPGFFGLNKQDEGGVLPEGWGTVAENCIIDDQGRIGCRKGSKRLSTASTTGTVQSTFEYIDGSGNLLHILAMDNKIYKVAGTSLTDISGTITTPTANHWKFVNFNGKCVGYQSGHAPIVLATTGGNFADITLSGTQQPTTAANECLAAFGRIWVLDGTDLKYSDSLDETAYNGVFDLTTVFLSGMDVGIALAEYNGHLVVFGERNIVIYNNPWVPTGGGGIDTALMTLVESIGGIGCYARDSVQMAGSDLIWLSYSGVRTLARTIQEKSMPDGDISRNIRNYLSSYLSAETAAEIKSTYTREGFYLLSLPTAGKSFYFNLKQLLQDGSARVCEWTIAPTALLTNKADETFFGFANYIEKYQDYRDSVAAAGTGGSSYTVKFESGWDDRGNSSLKIPKKLSATIFGGSGVITLKWAFDYIDTFSVRNVSISSNIGSEYNTAEYNLDEYSGSDIVTKVKAPMSKTGQVIKYGINYTVDGSQIAIQRLDLQVKIGKITI